MIELDPVTIVEEQRDTFTIGIPCIAKVSAASFTDRIGRTIDSRPCEAFSAADTDWGEDDSLANVPRKSQPTWIRALFTKGEI